MKILLEKPTGSKVKITIEIGSSELEKYYQEAKNSLAKNLDIRGFRKGEVPPEVAEEKLGAQEILQKASLLAIQESYLRAIRENKLEVVGEPRVKIIKLARGNPFVFEVEVSLIPKIKLPDYKEIAKTVERKKINVEEKEISESLNWLRESRVQISPLDKPAEVGNFVEIEYSSPSLENGRLFRDRFFLGKGNLVKEFEENIKGMRKGEEKEFPVLFPQDYFRKDLRGKRFNFKLKLKSVSEAKFPEINDEFAQKLGNFQNLLSLKESIREGIRLEKEKAEEQRVVDEIIQKISSAINFDIPEILLNVEKERLLKNLKENVKRDLKLEFEKYLLQINKSQEEVEKMISKMAEENIKKWLIIREIAKKENIVVPEEEIEARLNKILKDYPSVEKTEKEIDLDKLRAYTKGEIENKKVLNFLNNLVP